MCVFICVSLCVVICVLIVSSKTASPKRTCRESGSRLFDNEKLFYRGKGEEVPVINNMTVTNAPEKKQYHISHQKGSRTLVQLALGAATATEENRKEKRYPELD